MWTTYPTWLGASTLWVLEVDKSPALTQVPSPAEPSGPILNKSVNINVGTHEDFSLLEPVFEGVCKHHNEEDRGAIAPLCPGSA